MKFFLLIVFVSLTYCGSDDNDDPASSSENNDPTATTDPVIPGMTTTSHSGFSFCGVAKQVSICSGTSCPIASCAASFGDSTPFVDSDEYNTAKASWQTDCEAGGYELVCAVCQNCICTGNVSMTFTPQAGQSALCP
jgi:hypothetical protein